MRESIEAGVYLGLVIAFLWGFCLALKMHYVWIFSLLTVGGLLLSINKENLIEMVAQILGTICIAFAILLLVFSKVWAHDHEHPENDACLAGLQSKSGTSCCDGQDATRLDDAQWDAKDGHYRVELEGEWVDVPDNALIMGGKGCPGPTRVWTMHLNGKLYPRCFAPGAGG